MAVGAGLGLFYIYMLVTLLLSASAAIDVVFRSFADTFGTKCRDMRGKGSVRVSSCGVVYALPASLLRGAKDMAGIEAKRRTSVVPVVDVMRTPAGRGSAFRTLGEVTSFVSIVTKVFYLLRFFCLVEGVGHNSVFD